MIVEFLFLSIPPLHHTRAVTVCLSVCVSVCLSLYLSIYLCVYVSLLTHAYLHVLQSLFLCLGLSFCLSVCMSPPSVSNVIKQYSKKLTMHFMPNHFATPPLILNSTKHDVIVAAVRRILQVKIIKHQVNCLRAILLQKNGDIILKAVVVRAWVIRAGQGSRVASLSSDNDRGRSRQDDI